ncbi:MAG: protein phosphatase 2C domain-containing protein [Bacteroidota bacterium]
MILAKFYYLNETGSKKNQEDFIWPAPRTVGKDNKIFIVCDGVGGSSKGEIASRLVAEYMGNALSKADISLLSIERINTLLEEARNVLKEYARTRQTGTDMATTFTLLALHADRAFIAWCGDSRVYHFRSGKVLYKTEDHSLVNSLVKAGEISETDAIVHPQKNVILKAIKADSPSIEAEGGWSLPVEDGDYFLLCTDGLLENWRDDAIADLLSSPHEDNVNLADLFQKKSLNNTRDNYSMYLVQTTADPEQPIGKKTNKNKVAGLVLLIALVVLAVIGIVYSASRKQKTPVTNTPVNIVTDSIAHQQVQQPAPQPVGDSGAHIKKLSPDTNLHAPVHFQIINPKVKDSVRRSKHEVIVIKTAKKKIPKDSAASVQPLEPVLPKQKEDSTKENF